MGGATATDLWGEHGGSGGPRWSPLTIGRLQAWNTCRRRFDGEAAEAVVPGVRFQVICASGLPWRRRPCLLLPCGLLPLGGKHGGCWSFWESFVKSRTLIIS